MASGQLLVLRGTDVSKFNCNSLTCCTFHAIEAFAIAVFKWRCTHSKLPTSPLSPMCWRTLCGRWTLILYRWSVVGAFSSDTDAKTRDNRILLRPHLMYTYKCLSVPKSERAPIVKIVYNIIYEVMQIRMSRSTIIGFSGETMRRRRAFGLF